jgi:hypothetical protein
VVPAANLAGELLELVREPARELGTLDLLAPLDAGRCEADRQLEIGRTGGLDAVCADLVDRTVR